jgi:hypothetical protein
MPMDLAELRTTVQRLHVHYDVEPELDLQGRTRVKVGLIVRLWGVHAKGAKALPGCTKCWEVVAELRKLAEFALDHDAGSLRVDVEPMNRRLYDSRVVQGADEVSLPIRIATSEDRTAPTDARAEAFLKKVRGRLRELGVPER